MTDVITKVVLLSALLLLTIFAYYSTYKEAKTYNHLAEKLEKFLKKQKEEEIMKSIWKQDKNERFFKEGRYYYRDKGLLLDLTLMFGEGNEPKDVNDERLKALEVYK